MGLTMPWDSVDQEFLFPATLGQNLAKGWQDCLKEILYCLSLRFKHDHSTRGIHGFWLLLFYITDYMIVSLVDLLKIETDLE